MRGVLCLVAFVSTGVAGPQLVVSSETAPPGATVQFKLSLTSPAAIGSADIVIDFDPGVFGDIPNVAAFSAAGDALGYANVNGRHVDAHFSSPSNGIGRLPDLPVFTVSIPLLAGATPGTTVAVMAVPSGAGWQGVPGRFTVGGRLSVASVTPGGGLLPAGTLLRIAGTGFDSTTQVSMDGVSISTTQPDSPQEIDVTLGGATEITGKRVHVSNSGGEFVDYFPSLPSAPANTSQAYPGVQPLVPLQTTAGTIQYGERSSDLFTTEVIALLNQNPSPVDVDFVSILRAFISGHETITIPPGTLYFLNLNRSIGSLDVTPSAPIRMLQYFNTRQGVAPPQVTVAVPIPLSGPLGVSLDVGGSYAWSWQIGTPQPSALSIGLPSPDNSGDFGFGASVSSSGGQWLTVTPLSGTLPSTLTVTPNLTGLKPGAYSATISVTPTIPASLIGFTAATPSIFTISLIVSADPFVRVSGNTGFFAQPGGVNPLRNTWSVVSNGNPAMFSATVSTDSGGNWLAVTPSNGVTPGTLTLTADATGLAAGTYSGNVTIQGPANTVTVPVALIVIPAPPPPPSLLVNPSSLSFDLESMTGPSANAQVLAISLARVSTVSVQTQSGGSWLTAQILTPGAVSVNASAIGLAAGVYTGTVTLGTTTQDVAAQVPVTLTVYAAPTAPLTVSPSSLIVTAPAYQSSPAQTLTVSSGGTPVLFTVSSSSGILQVLPSDTTGHYVTSATFSVTLSPHLPGEYHDTLTIQASNGTVAVPVTLYATPTASSPLIISAVVNGASQTAGTLSPGEIITMHGHGIGPAPGRVGAAVLINGAAAPLIYVSPDQFNAVVPYQTATTGVAKIEVSTNGATSGAWEIPLAPSAPGIFTIGSTGVGQAAVLNQDNSVNGVSNPARRGTVVQIFGTGVGVESLVTVTIGGVQALITFAGPAPGLIGLSQVNALVPAGVMPGSSQPIVMTNGGKQSQTGVTIAIQ